MKTRSNNKEDVIKAREIKKMREKMNKEIASVRKLLKKVNKTQKKVNKLVRINNRIANKNNLMTPVASPLAPPVNLIPSNVGRKLNNILVKNL